MTSDFWSSFNYEHILSITASKTWQSHEQDCFVIIIPRNDYTMNIRVPHSWLSEFVKTDAQPKKIAELLSLHSASVERVAKEGDDWVYDIEITTNRIDMACINGLAREVTAVLKRNAIDAEYTPLTTEDTTHPTESLPITIKNDRKLCRRILGVVIDNVSVGTSPDWMRKRLEKSGVRSLNSIVDITNYVMLETGQPVHVFDYDRIKTNTLIVRESKKGEHITTFDGKKRLLPGGDIVIDDGTGEIIDLPGIAGTKNSVVTDNTTRILFFTESNDQIRIRKTCMSLGLHTYASNINKNRPDPVSAYTAFLRGIELYCDVAGGTTASRIVDDASDLKESDTISVPQEKITTYIGAEFSPSDISGYLEPLGFDVSYNPGESSYVVTIPSWRIEDMDGPEDVIEEIARMYGYHNVTSTVSIGIPQTNPFTKKLSTISRIKHALKYWGFSELYSLSLISEDILSKYGYDTARVIALKNPLTTDGAYLRPSLLPGLIESAQANITHASDIHLFELSRTYEPVHHDMQPATEHTMLSAVITSRNTDQVFYEAKGIVESILRELGITDWSLSTSGSKHPVSSVMHPKRQAEIMISAGRKELSVGIIGQFNDLGIFELSFDEIVTHMSDAQTFTPIPEHPPVIEDITITVKPETRIGPVMHKIRKASELITHVVLANRYENNVTFTITFQHPDRNLTDDEVGKIKEKILTTIK